MQKRLSDILYKCPVRELIGNADQLVDAIEFDSRKCKPGTVFFAIKGTQADGHQHIDSAVKNGASVVVCESMPHERLPQTTYVKVESSSFSLGMAASNFFDNPSASLKLVGVTGTNGKTTIATLLYRLFSSLGFACGLVSTIENLIDGQAIAATHTTPDPVQLNALLAKMVEHGCTYAFMEVSSHAIDQMRIIGLQFAGGIFTNLTHDHLDYHKTFANYRNAKKMFFDWLPASAFALTNLDDKNGMFMLQNTKAKKMTFALQADADYKSRILESRFDGLDLLIDGKEVYTQLVGRFNASNLLAIYAATRLLGVEQEEALAALSMLQSAEGRFQVVRSQNNITGIVDYAHTPDALENVLSTINDIRTHNEQLITVAGAGGDRDRTKRPEMAAVAAEKSDRLILTSDNPRSEEPQSIIDEMRTGVQPQFYRKVLAITDRREAIRTAVALANPGDIILVAGKGHEKYQEIRGVRQHFDDVEELQDAFKKGEE